MKDRSYLRPAILDEIALDRHCVIEASAGTGKTFTIEHLVVEILLRTDIRLEQILAVTFTEKAAAELRTRIRRTLEKTLRGDPANDSSAGKPVALDDAMARRLENALFSFERAPIHTIHSFCHRMLTELAFESGARMRLEVADARTMFHEAFRAELRERFASDEWMSRVLDEWLADDREPDQLETLLFDAYRRRYLESGAVDRNTRAAAGLLECFDEAKLKHAMRSANAKGKALTVFEDLREAVKISNRDPWLLRRALESIDLTKLADLAERPGLTQEARRFFSALRTVQCASNLESRTIDTFVAPVAARLDLTKRECGIIDYDDMPGWLWSALDGPQGDRLAATLRERFRTGIVDEFQDTDDLQWRIFRRVFVESDEHRLFVIGDPKQAIYAFRDADVFTYLDARKELVENRGAKFIPLIRNFRSTADMIDAVNLIFAPSQNQTLFVEGGIHYDHPVVCARPDVSVLEGGKPAKPITLFSLPPGASLSARRYRMMIGRKMAATLKSLIDGSAGLEITGPNPRTVPAREVFVLTRTLMESREMAGYLREAGVPYAFYKQDGLFKTREAGHVLDVLRAVADPQRRSNRLKAWATPFFGVALRDLPGLDDVAPSHPLMARLLEWKALAEAERFAELFSAMLHQSGLAARELLLADSQRELTNYEHIFEVLLENTTAETRDLIDLVQMLSSWVDGDDLPPGESPGVQRLESERDAVQIMTVHKAKGLEADVVMLFGGYAQAPSRDKVWVFHAHGERQIVAGPSARAAAKVELDRESSAEEERLLYVAMTRARAKLYLAMFPEGSTLRPLTGYYRKMNDRLLALEMDQGAAHDIFVNTIETVPLRRSGSASTSAVPAAIGSWMPPEALLKDDGDRKLARSLRDIVTHHGALAINSYTSMQRRASMNDQPDEATFKYDLDSDNTGEPGDLAGGRAVGIFLHEVIERLDLDVLRKASDLASWKASPGVRELIAATARRHQVRDSDRWNQRAAEVVFNALRAPIALGKDVAPGLANCEPVREMAFTFPIPAPGHPLVGSARAGNWKIERGLLIGFVDLVFRLRGRTYFADWKSDRLDTYDDAVIAAHVADRYLIQAQIYTTGIVRLLRIRDRSEYEQRFGGLVYVFLRGVEPRGDGHAGVYFHRPSWDEIVAYEQKLMPPA